MNKITIIGDSGSGKTSYLWTMYHYLSSAYYKGFTLSCMESDSPNAKPDYDKEDEFYNSYLKLKNTELGFGRFPLRSNDKQTYFFSLKYKLEDVLSFGIPDYPGGVIDRRECGTEEYLRDLRESDSWVIFIDGEKLHEALVDIKDPDERKHYLHEKVFGKYIRCMRNNASIIPTFISIIVTKSDLLLKPLIKKKYAELTNCSPSERVMNAQTEAKKEVTNLFKEHIFDNIPEERFQISISFVTLGDTIAENNYTGKLEPRNIEFPITISLLSILEKECKNIKQKIKALENEIERIRQSIFAPKEKRIALQKEIDNTWKPKLEFKNAVATVILERINDDVILYNHGRNNQVSAKDYFNHVFNSK